MPNPRAAQKGPRDPGLRPVRAQARRPRPRVMERVQARCGRWALPAMGMEAAAFHPVHGDQRTGMWKTSFVRTGRGGESFPSSCGSVRPVSSVISGREQQLALRMQSALKARFALHIIPSSGCRAPPYVRGSDACAG